MPTLHWLGKEKVVNHHQDVPFRVLESQYTFGGDAAENRIIHGDNLEALKALLPYYEGRVKCIYIDPPYNTGNEGWAYNDNVNDPKIKRWIGKVVGKESEDLTRHDKWLCMMYPRLQLLHRLLADDGVIFVSIDDNELTNLKVIMDEIFGIKNFVEYFSWVKTSTPPSLARKSRKTTEYVLCYEKNRSNSKYNAEEADGGDAPLLNTGNAVRELIFPASKLFFKIPDGTYHSGDYERVKLVNTIVIKDGYANTDVKIRGEFKWTQETLRSEVLLGTTFIVKSDKFSIRFLRETEATKAPTNLLKESYYTSVLNKRDVEVDTNEAAKKELEEIFGVKVFDYPKPTSLIKFFLRIGSDKDSIILDSFAGSGTTAHAVLNLNKQDGGNRKFILVEMEDYAETITAERVRRVMNGYGDKEGTGGSFTYYELGPALFDENNLLNEAVPIDRIREYVWYSETRLPHLFKTGEEEETAHFLGKHEETAYYFYYKSDALTTLDYDFLTTVRTLAEQYVIYADNCLIAREWLQEHRIIFKKIPRDINRF